jgi:hypothetical protein
VEPSVAVETFRHTNNMATTDGVSSSLHDPTRTTEHGLTATLAGSKHLRDDEMITGDRRSGDEAAMTDTAAKRPRLEQSWLSVGDAHAATTTTTTAVTNIPTIQRIANPPHSHALQSLQTAEDAVVLLTSPQADTDLVPLHFHSAGVVGV